MADEIVRDSLTLTCCHCGKPVTFAITDEGYPTVFHPMPTCPLFDDANTTEEVSAYMKECGKKYERASN